MLIVPPPVGVPTLLPPIYRGDKCHVNRVFVSDRLVTDFLDTKNTHYVNKNDFLDTSLRDISTDVLRMAKNGEHPFY